MIILIYSCDVGLGLLKELHCTLPSPLKSASDCKWLLKSLTVTIIHLKKLKPIQAFNESSRPNHLIAPHISWLCKKIKKKNCNRCIYKEDSSRKLVTHHKCFSSSFAPFPCDGGSPVMRPVCKSAALRCYRLGRGCWRIIRMAQETQKQRVSKRRIRAWCCLKQCVDGPAELEFILQES